MLMCCNNLVKGFKFHFKFHAGFYRESLVVILSKAFTLRPTMDRDKVWVADPKAGFVLGNIVEIGDDGPVVQPHDRKSVSWIIYYFGASKIKRRDRDCEFDMIL